MVVFIGLLQFPPESVLMWSNVWISGITGQIVVFSLFLVSEEFNVNGRLTLKLYTFPLFLKTLFKKAHEQSQAIVFRI